MAGIYVTTKLYEQDCARLRKFVAGLPLPEGSRMKEEEFHITLAYSKEGFAYKHSDDTQQVEAKPLKWDIFGVDEKVLVLVMESEELQQRFEELCAQGYVCKFPDYKPHVTVGMAPPESVDVSKFPLPDFNLRVEYEYSEPLDDSFSYNPKEMCENQVIDPLQFSFIHFMLRPLT